MRNYRDLRVWQAAHELTLAIYRQTQVFPQAERFGLTSQIRRACASIGANLAEGCGRGSSTEMGRYVQIAMGSASELDYHLLLASDLGLLPKHEYTALDGQLSSVRKMLASFQQTLKGETTARAAGALSQKPRANSQQRILP